jgi:hypothetical protein
MVDRENPTPQLPDEDSPARQIPAEVEASLAEERREAAQEAELSALDAIAATADAETQAGSDAHHRRTPRRMMRCACASRSGCPSPAATAHHQRRAGR